MMRALIMAGMLAALAGAGFADDTLIVVGGGVLDLTILVQPSTEGGAEAATQADPDGGEAAAFDEQEGDSQDEEAYSEPLVWIDLVAGMTVSDSLSIDGMFFGGMQGTYMLGGGLGVEFDLYYTGMQYYYYNGSAWAGPGSWAAVEPYSGGCSQWDYQFYDLRFLTSLSLAARFEALDDLFLHFSLGPAATIIAPSEAAEYYPEFGQAVDAATAGQVFVGWLVKAGLRYRSGIVSFGFDYLFDVLSPEDFFRGVRDEGFDYFLRAGSFALTVGLVL